MIQHILSGMRNIFTTFGCLIFLQARVRQNAIVIAGGLTSHQTRPLLPVHFSEKQLPPLLRKTSSWISYEQPKCKCSHYCRINAHLCKTTDTTNPTKWEFALLSTKWFLFLRKISHPCWMKDKPPKNNRSNVDIDILENMPL